MSSDQTALARKQAIALGRLNTKLQIRAENFNETQNYELDMDVVRAFPDLVKTVQRELSADPKNPAPQQKPTPSAHNESAFLA